jgi:hypothetical protein
MRHVHAADLAMARVHDQLTAAAGWAQTRAEVQAVNTIKRQLEDPAGWLMALAADRSEAPGIADAGRVP